MLSARKLYSFFYSAQLYIAYLIAYQEDAEESQRQKQQKATTRPTRKNESDAVSSSSGKTAFEELFKIDSKYLNSEFELKRIFGSKVINYERRYFLNYYVCVQTLATILILCKS